jgi:tetratricopeptide (TPR) repeat protein
VDRGQKSVILKNVAYYEMLKDSLPEAERHAYRAAMLAEDSSAVGNALSLLCQIYIKQNRYEKAQMLMSIMPRRGNSTLEYNRLLVRSDFLEKRGDYKGALQSYKKLKDLTDSLYSESSHLDIIKIQNQYDKEVIQREKAEQALYFSLAIIALLLIIFALTIWYNSRTKSLYKQYKQRIATVKEDTMERLSRKDSTIEEMKTAIDAKVAEIDTLKNKLPSRLGTDDAYDTIADTKLGVDVLYAILKDQNISQMGKREQHAVTNVMWTIDRELAIIISNPDFALTPKETFFCIMERNGKTDQQKATSFCCSEQAVRSTKSRLGKKIDLTVIEN